MNRFLPVIISLLLVLAPGIDGWRAQTSELIKLPEKSANKALTKAAEADKAASHLLVQRWDFEVLPAQSPESLAPETGGTKVKTRNQRKSPPQSPIELWSHWQQLVVRSEFQKIPDLGTLLAEKLRQNPDPAVYEEIDHLLAQADVSVEKKALAVDLLGEIATPTALARLLDLAENEQDSPLYFSALQVISHIGDNRWDGVFHEELSPALETVWLNPEIKDAAYLGAVANAIASIGAPEGVNKLLQTLSGNKGNKTDARDQETERVKQEQAFNAVPEVRNPNSVAVLSDTLQNEPLGTAGYAASGEALSTIGTPDAVFKILDYGKTAPEEAAPYFEAWLTTAEEGLSASSTQIKTPEDLTFQSEAIAQVFENTARQSNSAISTSATIEPENSGNDSITTLSSPDPGLEPLVPIKKPKKLPKSRKLGGGI